MTDTSKEAVLDAAQRFIDHYFNNPDTDRPEITIPAKESNSDLVLVKGIKALRAELDEAKAEIERLRNLDVEYGRVEESIIMADPEFDGDSDHANCAGRLIASVNRLKGSSQ